MTDDLLIDLLALAILLALVLLGGLGLSRLLRGWDGW
jgi:hypothetical protein